MKYCTKCKLDKPLSQFGKCKSKKDGHQQYCNACKLKYQQKNPNRKASVTKYREANKDICIFRSILSQQKNRAHYNMKAAEWQKANPEKVKATRARYDKKRQIQHRGLDAFSRFVFEEAKELVKLRNELTGVKWNIDHVIPISKGGTSEYTNIQVVPEVYNRHKATKLVQRYFLTTK